MALRSIHSPPDEPAMGLTPSPRTGDDAIRGTDDDAALSRLSCTVAGYLDDPFARHFVRRPTRRPPLINLGTFVRTWAMDRLVDRFLDADDQPRQILSFGAGTDTRFFRLWRDRQAPTQLVRYVEVDFPETTARKAQIIRSQPGLTSCLGDDIRVEQGGTALRSSVYNLIPGDLRSFPTTLAHALLQPTTATPLTSAASPLLDSSVPTLILAECVFIYLPADVSSTLLSWSASTFANSLVALYDPVGLDDAFGRVMVRNLRERNIVLHGMQATPSMQALQSRLLQAGFDRADVIDVCTIRRRVVPRAELDRVTVLERLDEVEELELVLAHYAVACASKGELLAGVSLEDQETRGRQERDERVG